MKKLALALMCFASVAFFASCTQEILHPEPSLAVVTGENYVYDGQTIDIDTEYMLGFRAASNSQTLKELSTFNLNVKILELDGTVVSSHDTLMNISGTEFIYDHVLNFTLSRELVGKAEITATVTDVDSKTATTTITLNVNQPAQPLVATEFTWNRHGSADATGLAEFGLKWTRNERAIYAVIEPLEDATLFKFEPSIWEQVTTDVEKAAAFEGVMSISQWKEFNTAGAVNQDLDVVLGTIYNEETHLIHITKGHIETFKGTDVTLTGEAK